MKGLLSGFQVGQNRAVADAATRSKFGWPLIGCLGKAICGNVARKVGTPLRCCPPAAGSLDQSR